MIMMITIATNYVIHSVLYVFYCHHSCLLLLLLLFLLYLRTRLESNFVVLLPKKKYSTLAVKPLPHGRWVLQNVIFSSDLSGFPWIMVAMLASFLTNLLFPITLFVFNIMCQNYCRSLRHPCKCCKFLTLFAWMHSRVGYSFLLSSTVTRFTISTRDSLDYLISSNQYMLLVKGHWLNLS